MSPQVAASESPVLAKSKSNCSFAVMSREPVRACVTANHRARSAPTRVTAAALTSHITRECLIEERKGTNQRVSRGHCAGGQLRPIFKRTDSSEP